MNQPQAAHRALIQSSPHRYEKPANDLDLRARIIALQEQVISLEQEQQSIAKEVKATRHWGVWAAATILLILGGTGVWQWHGQSQLASHVQVVAQKQDEQTKLLMDQSALLREAVVQLELLTQEKAKLGIKITDLPREAVEKELAARVGVSDIELRLIVEAGKKSHDALTRANANLLAGKLAEALIAADEAIAADSSAIQRLMAAYSVKAQVFYQQAKFEKALEFHQKAAALVDKTADPSAWAEAQSSASMVYLQLARYKEAEPIFREILQIREQNLSPSAAETATALNNLAELLRLTSRPEESEPLYRRALKLDEANFGKDHPAVARDLRNLALLLQASGRVAEAESMHRRALEITEAKFGPENSEVAGILNNLALLLHETNRTAEAEPIYRRALKVEEANFGPNHPNVAIFCNNLGGLCAQTNRPKEAETLYRRALKIDEVSLGLSHPNVAIRLNNLAKILQDTNRPEEAEQMYRRALKIDETIFGPEHPSVADDLNHLGLLMEQTHRLTEAEQMYRRALRIDEARFGSQHPAVARDLNNLSLLYYSQGQIEEAAPLSRRQLEILVLFRRSTGQDHPRFWQAFENYLSVLDDLNLSKEQVYSKLRDVLGPELAPTIVGPFQVTITEVVKAGQGEVLGLQAGDVYVNYNGQTITSTAQLIRLTSESIGEAIPLEVLRADKKLTFTAKPGKLGTRIENRPLPPATGTEPAKEE